MRGGVAPHGAGTSLQGTFALLIIRCEDITAWRCCGRDARLQGRGKPQCFLALLLHRGCCATCSGLAAHIVTENHAHSRGQACDLQSPAGTHRTCLLSVWCMCTLLHVSAFFRSGDAVQEYRCFL